MVKKRSYNLKGRQQGIAPGPNVNVCEVATRKYNSSYCVCVCVCAHIDHPLQHGLRQGKCVCLYVCAHAPTRVSPLSLILTLKGGCYPPIFFFLRN